MTPEQKFQKLFEEMYTLCEENNWGDPFSYARSREIHMAGVLGHKVAEDYAGADAYDEIGECEYKSTIGKNINATYNGISVPVSYTHLRAHETRHDIVCRLLLEKKKTT